LSTANYKQQMPLVNRQLGKVITGPVNQGK